MDLHDRLKPEPTQGAPKIGGLHAGIIAVALSLFAAGFAVAMPLAARYSAGVTDRGRAGPLASPSARPPAVQLPSPAVSARAKPTPTPSATEPVVDEISSRIERRSIGPKVLPGKPRGRGPGTDHGRPDAPGRPDDRGGDVTVGKSEKPDKDNKAEKADKDDEGEKSEKPSKKDHDRDDDRDRDRVRGRGD